MTEVVDLPPEPDAAGAAGTSESPPETPGAPSPPSQDPTPSPGLEMPQRGLDEFDPSTVRQADLVAQATEDVVASPEVVTNYSVYSHPYDRYFVLELETETRKNPVQFRFNDPEGLTRDVNNAIPFTR